MNLTTFVAVSLGGACALNAQQPVINDQGVTNAASYSILLAGGGLAPGSIVVIFGSGLGPATLQQAPAYPLTTELAGTRVQIGGMFAFLLYTSASQVAAVVPSTVQPGLQPVTVTFEGQTSAAAPTPVIATEFGIFTRNQAGYGQAAAQTVLLPGGEVRTLGLATSVRPGEPVVLYGTGLGAIGGAPDDRPPGAARTSVPVEVVIGGKVVAPDYAGRSPNYAGLDQINFTVPADLAAGCYVAVGVRADGRLSNVVTVPVTGTGRLCPHPFGITEQTAARVDAGGTITIAQVLGERRSSEAGVAGEGMGIGFAEVDANSLEITVDESGDPYESAVPGTCSLQAPQDNRVIVAQPRVSRPRFLDAGASVRLTGPSFSTDIVRTPLSGYGTNTPPGTLRAGTWTFSSGGGSDIRAFQMAAELPEGLVWTNRREVLDRSQPLRIEWTNGGSSPVRVVVSAGTQSGFAVINCTATAASGGITVPASLMSRLPVGGMGGVVLSQAVTRSGYAVPLAAGGVVDGSLWRVEYQVAGTARVE